MTKTIDDSNEKNLFSYTSIANIQSELQYSKETREKDKANLSPTKQILSSIYTKKKKIQRTLKDVNLKSNHEIDAFFRQEKSFFEKNKASVLTLKKLRNVVNKLNFSQNEMRLITINEKKKNGASFVMKSKRDAFLDNIVQVCQDHLDKLGSSQEKIQTSERNLYEKDLKIEDGFPQISQKFLRKLFFQTKKREKKRIPKYICGKNVTALKVFDNYNAVQYSSTLTQDKFAQFKIIKEQLENVIQKLYTVSKMIKSTKIAKKVSSQNFFLKKKIPYKMINTHFEKTIPLVYEMSTLLLNGKLNF
jgi:hypothetical protein